MHQNHKSFVMLFLCFSETHIHHIWHFLSSHTGMKATCSQIYRKCSITQETLDLAFGYMWTPSMAKIVQKLFSCIISVFSTFHAWCDLDFFQTIYLDLLLSNCVLFNTSEMKVFPLLLAVSWRNGSWSGKNGQWTCQKKSVTVRLSRC